jgi:hypothetical protein
VAQADFRVGLVRELEALAGPEWPRPQHRICRPTREAPLNTPRSPVRLLFGSVRTSQGGAPFDRADLATCHLYRDREELGSPKALARRNRRARCRCRLAGSVGDRLFGGKAAATRDLPELLRDVPVPGGLVAERLAGTATDAALPPDGLSEHAADAQPVPDVRGRRRRHLDCLRLACRPSRPGRRCPPLGESGVAGRVARDLPRHEHRRRRAPSKAVDTAARQLRRPRRRRGNQCRHRAANGKQLDRVRSMSARAVSCRARAPGARVAQLDAVSPSLGEGPRSARPLESLDSFAGLFRDRAERVHLAVAVERVVARPTLADLGRPVVDCREGRIDRHVGRTGHRIGRVGDSRRDRCR